MSISLPTISRGYQAVQKAHLFIRRRLEHCGDALKLATSLGRRGGGRIVASRVLCQLATRRKKLVTRESDARHLILR